MHKITLIPGDGIGPEIINVVRHVFEAANAPIEWEVFKVAQNIDKIVSSVKENKVALKGPISTPIGKGYRSINVRLRKDLDLYANVRPAHNIDGVSTPFSSVDIVVIRENLEDLYAGIEFKQGKAETKKLINYLASLDTDTQSRIVSSNLGNDTGISIKQISIRESTRVARFAFEYAKKYKRRKVTAVHKANIMKFTDGLFLQSAQKVAHEYPDIEFTDSIVDVTAMRMVKSPNEYDVLLCPNLYGDILSDLAAGLVGGLGVAPSANIGDTYALFEAVHGSAPKMAGKNKANPTAVLLSAVMMLEYLNEVKYAKRITSAIEAVISKGKNVTYDLRKNKKGGVGTIEMGRAIIKNL